MGAQGDGHHADGPPDLPGPHPCGDRRDPRRLPRPPASRTSSPSAATRRATRPRPDRATTATPCDLLDDIAGDRLLDRRRRPSRGPPPFARPGHRPPHLAAKLRRADFAITQFFFEAEHYLRLVDELLALGVDKPVLPGDHADHQRRPGQADGRLSGAALPAGSPTASTASTTRSRSAGSASTSPRRCAPSCSTPALRAAPLHAQPQHGEPRDLRQPRARRASRPGMYADDPTPADAAARVDVHARTGDQPGPVPARARRHAGARRRRR